MSEDALDFVDMNDKRITFDEWLQLRAASTSVLDRVLKDTKVNGTDMVRTIWTGHACNFGGEYPYGVILADHDGRFVRVLAEYPTRQTALEGHDWYARSLTA